jgi:hypothetical protein
MLRFSILTDRLSDRLPPDLFKKRPELKNRFARSWKRRCSRPASSGVPNEWKDVVLERNALDQMFTGKQVFEEVKVVRIAIAKSLASIIRSPHSFSDSQSPSSLVTRFRQGIGWVRFVTIRLSCGREAFNGLRYLFSSTKKIFHPLNNRAGLIHEVFYQSLEILAAGGIHVQIGLFGFG